MSKTIRQYKPNLEYYENNSGYSEHPISFTVTSFVGGKELGKAIQMTFSCPDCLSYSYFHLSEKQIKDLIKVLQNRLKGVNIINKTVYQNGEKVKEDE